MTTNKIDNKTKFNALSNAIHIFALKEEATVFKLLEIINGEDNTKAVAVTTEGEVIGIFTDSKSAKATLNEVFNCFGDDQPFVTIKIKETAKNQSVYYAEVV